MIQTLINPVARGVAKSYAYFSNVSRPTELFFCPRELGTNFVVLHTFGKKILTSVSKKKKKTQNHYPVVREAIFQQMSHDKHTKHTAAPPLPREDFPPSECQIMGQVQQKRGMLFLAGRARDTAGPSSSQVVHTTRRIWRSSVCASFNLY